MLDRYGRCDCNAFGIVSAGKEFGLNRLNMARADTPNMSPGARNIVAVSALLRPASVAIITSLRARTGGIFVAKRYDVFLSCKNLGPDGKPTRDSVLAGDIYQYLFARNLSVFLSTFELEAQGVSAYKQAIDAALDASQVLVAIGTSTQNLESGWVRYEWDGFFNDIISGVKPHGRVFSYIDGVEVKSLPRALRQSQAIVHGDGSLEVLYRYAANALKIQAVPAPIIEKPRSESKPAPEVESLLLDLGGGVTMEFAVRISSAGPLRWARPRAEVGHQENRNAHP